MVEMSNPPGTHDDVLTAVGMVLADLTAQPDHGPGAIYSPTVAPPVVRTLHGARPSLPTRLAVRRAARIGPRGLLGLFVPGSANDPKQILDGRGGRR